MEICYQCKKQINIEKGSCGTGYGIDNNDKKKCYTCIGENEKQELRNSKIGDKFYGYFSNDHYTNWPSSLKIKPYYKKESRHNWGCIRTDFWFNFEGKAFWGYQIGENNEIARIRRIKKV